MTSPVRERLSRWGAATRATLRSTWLSSLKVRTMTITALVTALAIIVCGTYLLLSIGGDLFNTRKDQVLADSARATASAQRLLDASDASDRVSLNSLVISMRGAIRDTSSSQLISLQRMPGQKFSFDAPQNFASEGLSGDVVTDELVQNVRDGDESQYWQSVTLTNPDGSTSAGIIVGSRLVFPGSAGTYGLYIGYSLSDAEQTLGYVQRTLLITGLLLMAMLGVLVWTIVRLVFRPIRVAADTSRRLASGESDVRMPEQGDESFDMLSQSFNEMADSLQNRISDLAELSMMQQRFVSDVSHELRTPLTTIRLAGDLLYAQRAEFNPAAARTAELLHTQVDRFERLLNDLLEISRYDAGSVTLELEPTNLVRLAEEEVEGMHSLAEKSGSLVTLVANGGYLDADLDPRRIRRIVNNLLGNAIEHGEAKPIIVTVDSNETAVAISVRDYGVGMTPEAAERSFDRFWRADPSRKRTIGGTGLGLAISLEDATAHGGRLEVWSEPGHGTCFRLTLPRVAGAAIVRSPLPLIPADEEDAAYGGSARSDRHGAPREET